MKTRHECLWALLILLCLGLFAACSEDGVEPIEEPKQPCAQIDCSGHGTCALSEGKAICACDLGFHAEGLACVANDPSDPCTGIDCSGHGTCDDTGGSPICTCESGYHALGNTACIADEVDPCEGQDCSGHGTCAESGGEALCACDTGYHAEGLSCVANDPYDPCAGIDCSGHGTCADATGSPVCDCDAGYHAVGNTTCATVELNPCAGIDCSAQGTCAVVGGDTAVCICNGGFHADGLACVADDPNAPCAGIDCSGHGTCDDASGSAVCTCDDGYHAVGNTTCAADELTPCAGIDCSGHGTCSLVEGAALCICDEGWHAHELTCLRDCPAEGWLDTNTNLCWQNPPGSMGISPCLEWGVALTYCEVLELGGFTDWRLPNITELRSLVRGCPDIAVGGACGISPDCIDPSNPACWSAVCSSNACDYLGGPGAGGCFWDPSLSPACGVSVDARTHWSSTSHSNLRSVWTVAFAQGTVQASEKTLCWYTRCVR